MWHVYCIVKHMQSRCFSVQKQRHRRPIRVADLWLCELQDQIGTLARSLRVIIHRCNVKERLKSVMTMLAKLRHISCEPQHALPDVFLWLLQNNKRVAYHRIPAKELIYSPNDEETGKNCATVQTLFLKVKSFDFTPP